MACLPLGCGEVEAAAAASTLERAITTVSSEVM